MKTTAAKFFVMLVCIFVFSAVSFGATRTTFLPFQVPSVFDRVCIKKHAKKQAASQGEWPKNKLPQNPKAGERKVVKIKGVDFVFRYCPAGSFNRAGQKVTLSGFYIGETEVTQEQWEGVMGKNPSNFKGDKLPVEQVSWNTCQEFIKKLNDFGSAPEGYKFALPTEAQWEYACRAGSKTAYCFGDDDKQLGDYAWYSRNSGSKTHEVGTKKANAWGIYDMHGNVWEWCSDWYEDYPHSDVVDPTGASSGADRVFRGSGWVLSAEGCRSAFRYFATPGGSNDDLGLRLALVPSK